MIILCKKKDCLRGEAKLTTEQEFLNKFTVKSLEGKVKRFNGLLDAGGDNIIQEKAVEKSTIASPAPTPFLFKEAHSRPIAPHSRRDYLLLYKGETAHESGGEDKGE